MIEDLRLLAYQDSQIDNNSLLNYLLNKTNLINNPDLPAFMINCDKQAIMKLISNLD